MIQDYKEYLILSGKSQNTISSYVKDVEKFNLFFSIKDKDDVGRLTAIDIQRFYVKYSKELKDSSLNSLIRNILAYFNWMTRTCGISKNHPFFEIKMNGKTRYVKEEIEPKVILTKEEVAMVVRAGRTMQERFMLALMFHTALRRSEIAKIKLDDVKECEIKIIGKGKKHFLVYMNETLCHMYNIYMTERKSDSPYVFFPERGFEGGNGHISGVTINNRVKRAVSKSGIPEDKVSSFTAHGTRRTRITEISNERGIDIARQVAHHASISTTKRYVQDSKEIVKDVLTR